jgi:hypothetical protein
MNIDTNALVAGVGILVTCGLVMSGRNNAKLSKIENRLSDLTGITGKQQADIAVLFDFKYRSERREEMVATESRRALLDESGRHERNSS